MVEPRTRRDDGGFTLIELLLVIIILGVLSGIAVFAVDPFQQRADAGCHDARDAMTDVVDAADDAGFDVDFDTDEAAPCP